MAVYVREPGVLTGEEAVRKMTSVPARRFSLFNRGLLRPGMVADVVCFDPAGVRDLATYDEPRRLPEGIPCVIVNGRPVVAAGRHTGDLPGRAQRPAHAVSAARTRSRLESGRRP